MKIEIGKSFLLIVIMIASIYCMTVFAAETIDNTISEVYPSGRGAMDYEVAYGPIFDELDTENEYGWYTIWDINSNGTCEIIIGHGENPDNYMNDVWAVNDAGSPVYIGSFESECEFYQNPNGKGIIAVKKQQEKDKVIQLTLEGGDLMIKVIDGGDWDPDKHFYNDESMLVDADIRNRGNLEFWSFIEVNE